MAIAALGSYPNPMDADQEAAAVAISHIYRLIDAAALQKVKPGALLLNTARGALVDEQAVADALHAGTLGGYGADVVTVEPIPAGHPLLTAPRCILTPHIAWAPKETRIRLHRLAAENLRAYLAGHPINVVNP